MKFLLALLSLISLIYSTTATSYNIYVSTYGTDSSTCGYGTNSVPCQTILGAINSYIYFVGVYGNNNNGNPLSVLFYYGYYYPSSTPINLAGYNVTFSVAPYVSTYSYGSEVMLDNNALHGPFFTISPSYSAYLQNQATYVSFNGISCTNSYISGGTVKMVGDDAYLLSIHKNSYDYPITVEMNNIDYYSANSPMVNVIDSNYIFEQSLASDWDSSATDMAFYQSGLPGWFSSDNDNQIVVNIYNSSFSNGVYYRTLNQPIVFAPKVPISLKIKDCNFSKVIVSATQFVVARGQLVIDNLNLTDATISYVPFFVAQNAEVYIKNSNIGITLTNTAFMICVGCFMNYDNTNSTVNYDSYSWQKDYPLLDIERSSATIMNSNFIFAGLEQQNNDQGIIYALNSNINLRFNSFATNISQVLYSDGSNIFTFWNIYPTVYGYSSYVYLQDSFLCTTDHPSTFRGDMSNNDGKNCNYYSTYQQTIYALEFVFVGMAVVLLCFIGFIAVRSFFRCLCRKNRKNNIDTHTYTPICDIDTTSTGIIANTTTTTVVVPNATVIVAQPSIESIAI